MIEAGDRGTVGPVVHLLPTDLMRGAQVIVNGLCRGLADPDDDHVILTLFDGPEAMLPSVHRLRVPDSRWRRLGFDVGAAVELRKAFEHLQPSVVVAHGSEPLKYAIASGRRPIVFHRIGIAVPAARRGWRRRFHRLLAGRAALVIAISNDVRDEVIDLFGVPPDRVLTIPNGRDPDAYASTPRPATGAARLLFVGHLTRTKRPELFLDVVRALEARGLAVTASIAGNGPLLEAIRAQAPGNVEVLGARHDVADLLRKADVLVFTSVPDGEGMPGVLIEAAMAGLPIVTTRVPGSDVVVVDGVSGHIVPADDGGRLVEAVAQLVSDPQLRTRMGAAARVHALENFGLDRQVVEWRIALRSVRPTAHP